MGSVPSTLVNIHTDKVVVGGPVIGKDGFLQVNATYTKGGELVEDMSGDREILNTPVFETESSTVSISLGATIPMEEKYSFFKVDVFCSVPCYVAEIENAYSFARNKAQERLKKLIAEYKVSKG